jgi:hypothetical protein
MKLDSTTILIIVAVVLFLGQAKKDDGGDDSPVDVRGLAAVAAEAGRNDDLLRADAVATVVADIKAGTLKTEAEIHKALGERIKANRGTAFEPVDVRLNAAFEKARADGTFQGEEAVPVLSELVAGYRKAGQ